MTQLNAQCWDVYWRGNQRDAAYSGGGTSHPSIVRFWDGYFARVGRRYSDPTVVDVASGNGAVAVRATSGLQQTAATFTCLDISLSAVRALRARAPGVCGLVADARAVPLASCSYDIAISQFGIEYAGLAAVDEAARLVRPGGQLAFLLHFHGGGIFDQCRASCSAIEEVQRSEVFAKCSTLFEEIFAADRRTDRCALDCAVRQFTPAIANIESVIRRYGRSVADGTIARLYQDIRSIHERLAHFDEKEVLKWLNDMQHQVTAFHERMESMCNAALDAVQFAQLCNRVEAHGYSIIRKSPLVNSATNIPLAWALIADKDAQ